MVTADSPGLGVPHATVIRCQPELPSSKSLTGARDAVSSIVCSYGWVMVPDISHSYADDWI